MKKTKNILLLLGICLYMLNVCLECYTFLPNVDFFKQISPYVINNVLIMLVAGLLFVTLPTILLCMNIKGKYSKVFTIIVIVLNSLFAVYLSINTFLTAIPTYLIYSKLGILDTYLIYLLPGGGLLRSVSVISFVVITIGAILSIKKKNS